MDPLQIIQLVFQYGPMVKEIIDEALTNEDLITKITHLSKPLANLLTDIGSKFFPKAAADLHLVGGAIAAFDPNVTKWLQGSLNVLVVPSPNLVVDGIYGQKTRDAVEALQKQLGLTMDGLAGQITQAAISAAMAHLPNLTPPIPAPTTQPSS
jgi:peptidoglycan hydrolase-like protein with peptidoglycan-binding domain